MKHSVPSTDPNDGFVDISFEDVTIQLPGDSLKRHDEPKDKDELYMNWKVHIFPLCCPQWQHNSMETLYF